MYCTNCGNYNPEEAKSCSSCGTPINTGTTPNQESTSTGYQPYNSQQTYGQSPYESQPVVSGVVPGKGAGIASLILGIVSLVFFCMVYVSVPTGIAAIITGAISISKAKAAGHKSGMGVAGIVCAVIGMIVSIGLIVAAFGFIATELGEGFEFLPY